MTRAAQPDLHRRPRRVFLEAHELPALLRGVWRAEPHCLRRILGARRGGRYGILFGLVGLALAAPPSRWPALAAAHALLSLLGLPLHRRVSLGALPNQRLLLWSVGPVLALCAIPRAAGAPALFTALAALALAHAHHARSLAKLRG